MAHFYLMGKKPGQIIIKRAKNYTPKLIRLDINKQPRSEFKSLSILIEVIASKNRIPTVQATNEQQSNKAPSRK